MALEGWLRLNLTKNIACLRSHTPGCLAPCRCAIVSAIDEKACDANHVLDRERDMHALTELDAHVIILEASVTRTAATAPGVGSAAVRQDPSG